ncbi:hypothetical protein SDC9_122384 [bioreactor metagenome]|uniref:Uncharacterized protein n=1 Tax=bioreactor metagenome TaxID=1076179 RepID=A0A645CEW1_9ZZZZ
MPRQILQHFWREAGHYHRKCAAYGNQNTGRVQKVFKLFNADGKSAGGVGGKHHARDHNAHGHYRADNIG